MNIFHKGKSSFGIKKILPFITVLFLIIIMVLPYQYKIIANTMCLKFINFLSLENGIAIQIRPIKPIII